MNAVRQLGGALLAVAETGVAHLRGPLGQRLRRAYYRQRLAHLGERVTFGVGVTIENPQYVSIGPNTWIDNGVTILAGPPHLGQRRVHFKERPSPGPQTGHVTIGANCHIAPNVLLQGHAGLAIGDNCGIGIGSVVYTVSHHYRNLGDPADATFYKYSPTVDEREQSLIVGPVVMEDNTGLAVNGVLLPGALLREGSWVGTGSVVMGEVPRMSIASGSPARVVKRRQCDDGGGR